jgi:hypothetical protein
VTPFCDGFNAVEIGFRVVEGGAGDEAGGKAGAVHGRLASAMAMAPHNRG